MKESTQEELIAQKEADVVYYLDITL